MYRGGWYPSPRVCHSSISQRCVNLLWSVLLLDQVGPTEPRKCSTICQGRSYPGGEQHARDLEQCQRSQDGVQGLATDCRKLDGTLDDKVEVHCRLTNDRAGVRVIDDGNPTSHLGCSITRSPRYSTWYITK